MQPILKPLIRSVSIGIVVAMLLVSTVGAADTQRTLLILSEGVPASMDVDGPAGNHGPTQTGFINVLETLVSNAAGEINEEGMRQLDFERFEGRLAESWTFDPATLTWTFKLRQNAVSCAGNPLTADDVLYSFARAKSLSGAAPVGWFLGNVASIRNFDRDLFGDTALNTGRRELGDEVEKVDTHTVRIRQSGPNQLFLPALSVYGMAIYDQREMRAHATADDPWSHDYAARHGGPSFGPWCIEGWRKEEFFSVQANPGYYRAAPWFKRIVVRKVPQSANRVGILRRGQAQLIENLSPKEYAFLEPLPEVRVAGGYLNATLLLMANWKAPPLDDERVRRALAHAIPYEQIIDSAYFGEARQYHGLVPSRYPGYAPARQRISYDPERARALLTEAGYPGGAGLERYSASFRLAYASSRESVLGPVATLLRTALRKVGFPIQLDPLPDVQLADRQLVKKDVPLSIYDGLTPIGVDAAYAILLSYVSPPTGLNNMTNFSDARVDTLFDDALGEPDPAARNALLAQAQYILMDRLAAIPVVEVKTQWAVAPDLHGLTLHPTRSVPWYDLYRADSAAARKD